MTASPIDLPRRALLAGAGLLSFSALAFPALAADGPDVKLIADFLKLWADPDVTGAKLAAFMTEDGEFRYERKAPVVGRAALTAAFDGYLAGGKRYKMVALETHAKGPVVFHYRHETTVTGGKDGATETIAGLFILKGGPGDMKIAIWENFLAEA